MFKYFPIISNSILTMSPLFRFDKLVSFNVCGITLISKAFLNNLEIVNEIPLIPMDPFLIRYFVSDLFMLNLTSQVFPIFLTCKTFDLVSI